MSVRQKGFTLIELVVVIVILAILAVVAAPRYLNLSSDAKAASIEGLKAAVADATSLAYSKAVVENAEDEPSYSVELEGGEHGNLQFGYPTTDTSGLVKFMEFDNGYHDLSKAWVWAARNHGSVATPDYWIATQSEILNNYSGTDFNTAIENTRCYVKYTAAMQESDQVEVISETSGC